MSAGDIRPERGYFDTPGFRPVIEKLAGERELARALLAPPVNTEPDAAQYCPRCHATYAARARGCVDCDQTTLLQFVEPIQRNKA